MHVEAGPTTPNFEENEIEMDQCPERDQERIGDCARSAMRSRYGDEYYRLGKSCEMVQIANECVDSINGNCATDAGFSRALSQLQQECDRQRYQECINKIEECVNSAMKRKYGINDWYHLPNDCEMAEIGDECVASINGNCATDARISRALSDLLSDLRRMCDNARP